MDTLDFYCWAKRRWKWRSTSCRLFASIGTVILLSWLAHVPSTQIASKYTDMNATVSTDLVLTRGFNCLDESDGAWAGRLSRVKSLHSRQHAFRVEHGPEKNATRVKLISNDRPRHVFERSSIANVPVVFIQQEGIKRISDSYADVAIRTACHFNRDVYVVTFRNITGSTDNENTSKWKPPPCAKEHWVFINGSHVSGSIADSRLKERLNVFSRTYVHMSGNPMNFERFCIERWFVLEALAEAEALHDLFYADCDVMVLSNASSELATMPDACEAHVNRKCSDHNCNAISGHSSYWSRGKLSDLSQFFVDAYDPKQPYIAQINKGWAEYQENYNRRNETVAGGVCDMWLIGMFVNTFTNGICFTDPAIYDHRQAFTDDDFVQDEFGLPYRIYINDINATILPMKTLHFQGSSKDLLIKCGQL